MTDRESRKKQITVRRKQQILDAALEVFVKSGYTAATIPQIAKNAGVAAGTIYIYFASKRELFIAVIENLIVTPLHLIFQQGSKKEFPVTLKEAINDRFRLFASGHLTQFVSLMGDIQRDPQLKELYLKKVFQPFLSRMQEVYAAHISSGEFRPVEPAVLVRMIGSIVVGLIIFQTLEGETSPLNNVSPDKLADEISNFILYGLLNQKSEL
jgi:AcrR family transcriptional regulator